MIPTAISILDHHAKLNAKNDVEYLFYKHLREAAEPPEP